MTVVRRHVRLEKRDRPLALPCSNGIASMFRVDLSEYYRDPLLDIARQLMDLGRVPKVPRRGADGDEASGGAEGL